jgi:hypothetical protein
VFGAFKPALDELTKNVKKAPGWVPLSVLCYVSSYLVLGDRDVLRLAIAEQPKQLLVEHKELLIVGTTFVLYILGDALDKFLWKRLEPRRIEGPRKKVEKAIGIQHDHGLYRVSKALAERAKQYEGSWIQVKNESAKMFRSLIVPSGVSGIILMVKGQLAWGVGGLVGVGVFGFIYLHLKAAHICDLYLLAADTLSKDPLYLKHDLFPGQLRLFFWDGEFAASAEPPKLEIRGRLRISEPDKPRKTVGVFSEFVKENAGVLRSYFKEDLFPGSLNVNVTEPLNLHADLDAGQPHPTFVIPRNRLAGMPDYIGDGQAWSCTLQCNSMTSPVRCWIFRRIGSRVPFGVIELVAPWPLVATYQLRDGEPVVIHLV